MSTTLELEEEAPSRRERKKLATRQAIHDAAFGLAVERGVAGVTVEAIADTADVAVRTFFNYFRSKEEAIVGRDPHRAETLHRRLLERPAEEDALTALRYVVSADLAERIIDPERSVRRARLIRSEPSLSAVAAAQWEETEWALVSAVSERTGRDPATDPYPSLAVAAIMGSLKAAHLFWADQGGQVSLQHLIAEAFDTLARGLEPPETSKKGRRK